MDILKNNEKLLRLRRNLYGARIVILGFAREGQDTFRFLRRLFPKKTIGIADRLEITSLPPNVQKLLSHVFHDREKCVIGHFGKDYLKAIKDYDVIIKSPGISLKTIKPFIKKEQKITSQTEIFFENCPGKIIGITGTKGKSTTASLIYEVLKEGGLKAHLVGNIGKPVLLNSFWAKPDDIFVYELSSHQLMSLDKSPQIAVFLNIYPEHLDYYKNFREYLRAKQNICRFQGKTDFFLYNPQNKYVRATVSITRAQKIALDPRKVLFFLKNCGRSDLPQFGVRLLGDFNLLNMAAALEVGRIFHIHDKKIFQTIKNFKPLSHRLEFIGEFRGIKFYNDSLATIPEATIAALQALGSRVETIFLGGFDRGLDFKVLAKAVLESDLKNIIFFPTTGVRIWREIGKLNRKNRFFKVIFTGKMKQGVVFAFKYTSPGKICLLSCASPSFGVFKDYRDRGEQFKKYVYEGGKNKF